MIVQKTWGSETWIVNRAYCGKRMLVYPGQRCSMHYHRVKDETFYVVHGDLLVRYVTLEQLSSDLGVTLGLEPLCRYHFQVQFLRSGDSFRVPTGMPHQFEALGHNLGPVEFFEFSTHHDDEDVVRVLRHDDPIFTQPSWEDRYAEQMSARRAARKK